MLRKRVKSPVTHRFLSMFGSGGVRVGSIRGNGAGGVTFESGAADFAEYLPQENPEAEFPPGTVVGLRAGLVGLDTDDADYAMVVSTAPIISGNTPEDTTGWVAVAFLGQVPVRVVGPVAAGDLLIASGHNDGTAVSVSAAGLEASDLVIGRALESAGGGGLVRALVGLPDPAPYRARLAQREEELATLEREVDALRVQLDVLSSRVLEVLGPHAGDPERPVVASFR